MSTPQSATQPSFLENVWLSIFTPGPTPALLIAANATFGALQLILALLLFFTYSIHFLILSLITGALWWSINWFAAEIAVVQREQAEKARREDTGAGAGVEGSTRVRRRRSKPRMGGDGGDAEDMDSGDDTETETEGMMASRSGMTSGADVSEVSDGRASPLIPASVGEAQSAAGRTENATFNTGAAARLAPASAGGEGTRRRRSLAESTGELSTDSEWEKVDDERR